MGLRVMVSRGLGSPFIGRRNGLSVQAGRGGSPESSGGRCASVQRRGRGKTGAGRRALAVRGRKEREAAVGLGRGNRRPRRGRRSGEARARGAGPSVAHAGRERKGEEGEWAAGERAGPRGREGRRAGRAERWFGLGWAAFLFSFLFFFSLLKLFKHNYLNSNKCEFKPY
jgi:hypothetical protein